MADKSLQPVSELPRGEFAFPGPLRDALVSAILSGTKTATSSLLVEYPDGHDPQKQVGTLEAVIDSHENVVCVIRTTEMRVCRLADIDDAHAAAEGEGYTDAATWRIEHERFWNSPEFRESVGRALEIGDDTLVVCQRFTVDPRYPTTAIAPF